MMNTSFCSTGGTILILNIFGKVFKGPKLVKISPNKTYAGMFGGYFLSIISRAVSDFII